MANPLYDALLPGGERQAAPFLIPDEGAVISHGGFADRALIFAAELAAHGLGPGDRLAVQLAKSPDCLALYAACLAAGIVYLPLNPAYTPDEIGYFLTDSQAALCLCDPAARAALAPVAQAAGTTLQAMGGAGGFALAAGAHGGRFRPVARQGSDLAAILYTSGTTGRSKGAMLTQDNLLSNARALVAAWRFTTADVLLHALPVFHTHGLFVASNVTLLAGGAMRYLAGFSPGAVLDALPEATAMMGVPTHYTRLLADPRLTREATAHMRLFVSGSAPMLPATHRQWRERTGQVILERYGMTETSMIASNPYGGDRRPGSVGFPLPGIELRIADPDTGEALPPGQTGGIEVKGPNVFAGYWRMPEKTASEFCADGYFRTGDMGVIDADGYLSIVGRHKDLIISGGLNIYPGEVEAALDALPGVSESAVIGVPHADFGEAVVAVIAAPSGAEPQPEALKAALAERLAGFKLPKHFVFRTELPRNAMGKVQKAELRRDLAGLFGPHAGG